MHLKKIPVLFSPSMSVHIESASPSSGKPIKVVDAWGRIGIPLEIIEPTPVTFEMLSLAHDSSYVRRILNGEIKNGFGNRDFAVARSLLFTSGAMLSAAREAIKNGLTAVAPCSGFHHAGFAEAGMNGAREGLGRTRSTR